MFHIPNEASILRWANTGKNTMEVWLPTFIRSQAFSLKHQCNWIKNNTKQTPVPFAQNKRTTTILGPNVSRNFEGIKLTL